MKKIAFLGMILMSLNAFGQIPYSDMFDKIKMIDYRDENGIYTIHVLGEVKLPGTYKGPHDLRLDGALKLAGDFTWEGNVRNVQIKRGVETLYFDLFKFRKQGDISQNPFLIDNDVIFIPSIADIEKGGCKNE